MDGFEFKFESSLVDLKTSDDLPSPSPRHEPTTAHLLYENQ